MNDVPGFGPNCRSIRYDTNFGSLPRANGSFRSMYKIPRYFLPFAAKDVSRVILLRTFVEKRTRLSRLSSCHRRWWLNKPRQALPLTTSHCTSKVSHSSIKNVDWICCWNRVISQPSSSGWGNRSIDLRVSRLFEAG